MKRVIKLLFKIFLKDIKNFLLKTPKEKLRGFAILVVLNLIALAFFLQYLKMQH